LDLFFHRHRPAVVIVQLRRPLLRLTTDKLLAPPTDVSFAFALFRLLFFPIFVSLSLASIEYFVHDG
jgi:hypothetical protein